MPPFSRAWPSARDLGAIVGSVWPTPGVGTAGPRSRRFPRAGRVPPRWDVAWGAPGGLRGLRAPAAGRRPKAAAPRGPGRWARRLDLQCAASGEAELLHRYRPAIPTGGTGVDCEQCVYVFVYVCACECGWLLDCARYETATGPASFSALACPRPPLAATLAPPRPGKSANPEPQEKTRLAAGAAPPDLLSPGPQPSD